MQDGTNGASADSLSAAVDSSQSAAAAASVKRSLLVDASDADATDVDIKRVRNETDGLWNWLFVSACRQVCSHLVAGRICRRQLVELDCGKAVVLAEMLSS